MKKLFIVMILLTGMFMGCKKDKVEEPVLLSEFVIGEWTFIDYGLELNFTLTLDSDDTYIMDRMILDINNNWTYDSSSEGVYSVDDDLDQISLDHQTPYDVQWIPGGDAMTWRNTVTNDIPMTWTRL